ncbi:MAG: DinB family protein [Bacteroidetes Order II. Incertae sedis bacterium]|nr:DinB family protein [Bacteroidetes Order II. bacterium]
MTRSQLNPMPAYFDRYINMTDEVTVEQALQTSLDELQQAPLEAWQTVGKAVYAPGKWTIPDILQHLIDTERVFCYRALSFARGEKEVQSYDEDGYGKMAKATQRSLEDLLEEALAVRKATLLLFQSFDSEMRERIGEGFKGPYSVHSIGFILAGHQRWHFRTIEERYLPLV